jgi:hypothetical protein
MPIDTKAKMLERVRALLAKADSTNFPEEAATFREKADELMTRYAIDAWSVQMAQEGVGARPAPERRDVNFDWWYGNPFKQQLWNLFWATANHCRCKVVSAKLSNKAIPVIGLSADLDYFDMLFTSLMLEMGKKIDPQPRSELSLEQNMAMFREAGVPWDIALNRLADAGMVEKLDAPRRTKDKTWWVSFKEYESAIRKYRTWCKRTGHPQAKVNQQTFRRNFADGFVDEIEDRFYRMRSAQETSYDAEHEAGSAALAIRDIRDVVAEAVFEFFPDLRPHPEDCTCAVCERRRSQKLKPVRYRRDTRVVDYAARAAGRDAGSKVNISNPAGKRVGRTPELPS